MSKPPASGDGEKRDERRRTHRMLAPLAVLSLRQHRSGVRMCRGRTGEAALSPNPANKSHTKTYTHRPRCKLDSRQVSPAATHGRPKSSCARISHEPRAVVRHAIRGGVRRRKTIPSTTYAPHTSVGLQQPRADGRRLTQWCLRQSPRPRGPPSPCPAWRPSGRPRRSTPAAAPARPPWAGRCPGPRRR